MYKYLNSILMYLGLIVLAIGFVNPGVVIANGEPSNGCQEGLSAKDYSEEAFKNVMRGLERLKKIPTMDFKGGAIPTEYQFKIHSAGYKTAGDRLVKAYQQYSCAKTETKVGGADTKMMAAEDALGFAATALIKATNADSSFVRYTKQEPLKEEEIKRLYENRHYTLELAEKSAIKEFKKMAEAIKEYCGQFKGCGGTRFIIIGDTKTQ